MKQNVKLAKQLIKLAKNLVAFDEQIVQLQQWCNTNTPNKFHKIQDKQLRNQILQYLVKDFLNNGKFGSYFISELLEDEHLENEQIYAIKDVLNHLDGEFLAKLITKYRK